MRHLMCFTRVKCHWIHPSAVTRLIELNLQDFNSAFPSSRFLAIAVRPALKRKSFRVPLSTRTGKETRGSRRVPANCRVGPSRPSASGVRDRARTQKVSGEEEACSFPFVSCHDYLGLQLLVDVVVFVVVVVILFSLCQCLCCCLFLWVCASVWCECPLEISASEGQAEALEAQLSTVLYVHTSCQLKPIVSFPLVLPYWPEFKTGLLFYIVL